ncbi:MAG: GNAT family N-acetyltransferase [Taibaiella sp.]|nr:GNAT family N-acetyltransferase [Taibaiella sp.]
MQPVTKVYNGYTITTDKSLMLLNDIHQWLSEEAYWSEGILFDRVKTAFDNSYCIGAVKDGRQVAYARLVTDYATFAYLADVYVAEAHRGKGISKKMMEILFEQDWVMRLRRMMLATINAHGLYRQYGFSECKYPERLMEKLLPPDIYLKQE